MVGVIYIQVSVTNNVLSLFFVLFLSMANMALTEVLFINYLVFCGFPVNFTFVILSRAVQHNFNGWILILAALHFALFLGMSLTVSLMDGSKVLAYHGLIRYVHCKRYGLTI